MNAGLKIPPSGALDFVSLGALVHRLDPGIIPFRKATHCEIHVSGGEFNVAANLSDCFRLKTGIARAMVDYPDRRPDRRARARHGREAVLQALQAQRRQRPQHGHGLQRPRPRRARAGGLLQPLQRGGGAAEAGRFRLEDDLRRRRALVPQRRHLRGAVGDHRRADHRRHEGRQGGRRGHLLRPQLPRRSCGTSGAARSARSRSSAASSKTSTCWSATRRICRRASASPVPRWRRKNRSSIPSAFFGMIDKVVAKHPKVQGGRHDAARGALHQPPQLERGGLDRRQDVHGADRRARRARPRRRRRRLRGRLLLRAAHGRVARGSGEARLGARRVADDLPRRYHHGDRASRCEPSPRAARRASSDKTRRTAHIFKASNRKR